MELKEALSKIKITSRKFALASDELVNSTLLMLAELLEKEVALILAANAKDLLKMNQADPLYDRVLLNEGRIKDIAESVREIAAYDSPINLVLEKKTLENGLQLRKVSTPIGVVGAIFEARPNVVVDIFSLCFKSRNACVMKGGSQSEESNGVLMELILKAIAEKAPEFLNTVLLLKNDRELLSELLQADEYVDVIVPRGGQGLIDFVRKNSLVPVIETGRGVCHTYFDKEGNLEKGKKIVFNAKVDRPSVCNSLDTLIIHKERLNELPEICEALAGEEVDIFADESSYAVLKGAYPDELLRAATVENFGTEYLSLKMSVKTVETLEGAIDHINTFGSGHSEAILTENQESAEKFLKAVDAAAVYVNASTRFTDGGVFGLGSEVGISTQKLHARGPMGIKELTSYKWEIIGDGQVR